MKKANVNRNLNKLNRHKKTMRKFKLADNGLYRLRVTKTNKHLFAQLLDDNKQIVVLSSSTLQLKLKNNNIENAKLVGNDIGKKMNTKKIKAINFDTGGNKYHGKIAALADEIRKTGVKF